MDQGTVGGQVILTHAVANYPGLPELSGYQLAATMRKQAEEFGCEVLSNATVGEIDLSGDVKRIEAEGESYFAEASLRLALRSRRPGSNRPIAVSLVRESLPNCGCSRNRTRA